MHGSHASKDAAAVLVFFAALHVATKRRAATHCRQVAFQVVAVDVGAAEDEGLLHVKVVNDLNKEREGRGKGSVNATGDQCLA